MKQLLENKWILRVAVLLIFSVWLSVHACVAQEQPTFQWYCNGQKIEGATGEDLDRVETVAGVYSYYRVTTYGGKSLTGATVVMEVKNLVPPSAELTPGVQWMTENLDDPSKGGVDGAPYGRFYTYEEAKVACPPGWRLPTHADVMVFVERFGGIVPAGQALRSTAGWANGANGTNASGLNLLPGGFGDGAYRGQFALLWCAEQGWNLYDTNGMEFPVIDGQRRSVRCVK